MRRTNKTRRTGVALLVGLAACTNAVVAAEHRQDVRDDWGFQHRYAAGLRRGQQPAPLVDEQAGTLQGDRDPTDQVARRTDALLKHLAKTFSGKAGWAGLRLRLDPLIATAKGGAPKDADRQKTYTELCALRREIALANPLLDFETILFSDESNVGLVLQRATTGGGNGLDVSEPGGSLWLIRGWKDPTPETADLCKDARVENGPYQGQTLAGGMFHAPSLSFDGRTVWFSWAKLHYREGEGRPPADLRYNRSRKADPLRIFRIGVDGKNLRQISTDAGPWNDTEPCELPDGRIAFTSTRREVYDRCEHCRPAFTLCSMKPDGTDIVELSFHETHEWLPSVANDGMILYSRWDYVDRATEAAHGFWTCFPDGRDARAPNGNYYGRALFKKNTPYAKYNPPGMSHQGRQPMAITHVHAVPGSKKVMGIGGSHHTCELGQVLLLDLDRPDEYTGDQVFALTPGAWGGDGGPNRMWSSLWPLSEDFLLANCMDRLYLVDRFGNWELVYRIPWARNQARLHNNAVYGWGGWSSRQPKEVKKAPKPALKSDLDSPSEDTLSAASSDSAPPTLSGVPQAAPKDREAGPRKPELVDFAADDPLRILSLGHWRPVYPQPVRARPRPPVISSQTYQSEDRRGKPGHQPATIVIMNVYDTDYPLPQGVKITRVRLVQVLGHSSGNYTYLGHNSNSSPKLNLGTVPVEADGSVHCLAPIEKGIYFQLLDEDGLAVHSMKSVTYVHRGERLSCRGCHEKYSSAAPTLPKPPLALRCAPSPVVPEGPDGKLMILDDYVKPAAQRVLAAAAKLPGSPPTVNANELEKSGWIWQFRCPVLHAPPDTRTTPEAFGARNSRLWEFVSQNRARLEGLEQDDLRLFALWLDLLCVDYSYSARHSIKDASGYAWPLHPDLDVNNPLGLEVVPKADDRQAMDRKESQR